MPVTTNYGWTMPTEGGDTGVWDTILNALFQDIDDQVFALEGRIEALEGYALASEIFISGFDSIAPVVNGVAAWDSGGVEYANLNPLNLPLRIPLRHLRVGMQITGFQSNGAVAGSRSATVSLYRLHDAGATQVSAGHALGSSTTGLTHDVLADNQYFLLVTPSGGSTVSDTTAVDWVKVTVIETP
jgi:hypothetical protein